MQVTVAGMHDVADAHLSPVADLVQCGEDQSQLAARDGRVQRVMGRRKARNRTPNTLARFPDFARSSAVCATFRLYAPCSFSTATISSICEARLTGVAVYLDDQQASASIGNPACA